MTKEDKDLLLRDLCARLPYGVKIKTSYDKIDEPIELRFINPRSKYFAIGGSFTVISGLDFDTYECKPYLFPLSSMTEEQTKEVHNLIYQGVSESVDETKEWLKTRKENDLRPITLTYILSYTLVIDWFNKNHFDYIGLIDKGLAIDATGLNIY